MTASPNNPPQVFASLSDAIQSLRDSGLRLSTARRLVLEALFAAEGPVSAAHLVRTLSLEESSVYRNLELLEERGVVRHLHLGHSPGLYVLTSEHEVEYLYCERCAKVAAVSPERLNPIRDQIEAEFGYRPRFTHFAIVGVCQDCIAGFKPGREQLHSHGDYVHSHPGRVRHTH
ncbi:MAG: transcriptional repressor [Solirubrobacterales bacterium]|nr:transcriptional repressor [Solirubrobacterales bacterium]